jgi:hypothetical protein
MDFAPDVSRARNSEECRQTLDEQQHHGDAGENGDAGDVLVDIGLVDHLAQDVGGAGGGAGGHAHQCEGGHIAPPIDKTLLHDEAANQDRRAIGIVGDFSGRFAYRFAWKFGHPRSIDGA